MIDHAEIDLNVKRAHLRNLIWKGPREGVVSLNHDYRCTGPTRQAAVLALIHLVHADVRKGHKITRWVHELVVDQHSESSMYGAFAQAMRTGAVLVQV